MKRLVLTIELPDSHDWAQDPAPLELEVTGYDRVVLVAVDDPHASGDVQFRGVVEE